MYEAPSVDVLPNNLKTAIARRLEKDDHDHAAWGLAEDGWRTEVMTEASERVSRMNTPSAGAVDNLFECLFDLKKLFSQWHWPGTTKLSVQKRLSSLLNMRHEIAHGVTSSRSVTKKYVEESNTFVIRLAAISSNRLRAKLEPADEFYPWGTFVKGAAE